MGGNLCQWLLFENCIILHLLLPSNCTNLFTIYQQLLSKLQLKYNTWIYAVEEEPRSTAVFTQDFAASVFVALDQHLSNKRFLLYRIRLCKFMTEFVNPNEKDIFA